MKFKSADFLRLIGLASRQTALDTKKPVLLTGAATDPQTGLIVSLASSTKFDAKGNFSDIKVKYWRQLPYGESRNQNIISIKMKPCRGKDEAEVGEIWVQSSCVYDSKRDDDSDPEVRKRVNRVLEGVNRLNTNLRKKGPVEDTAKILDQCYFDQVIGENMTIRGLKKEGGFDFSLSPYFMKQVAQGQGLKLTHLDLNMLKTVLGFRINTLEQDKDFSEGDFVYTTDPQSGVTYEAGVDFKEHKNGDVAMTMYIDVKNVPDDEVDAKAIPELVKMEFKKEKDGSYTLKDAAFLGQKVDAGDTETVLRLMGIAQSSNHVFADREYPGFMDSTAEYDLLDMVSPLSTPPALEKKGGEFLYTSLHGSSFEKKIENFGDQIGIADVFLHRGLKEDGSLSSVGVAVDFPFASGGPNSNFDGAVPDYLPFWEDLKAFVITHDHFDHCDGLPYYAKAGLMKEKDVYATKEVKYFLDKKMDFLKVPRRLRPKITIVEDDKPFAVRDEEGNARLWVQGSPNATHHSARCTPYIITGCYGDKHYNGSALVYGDGNGLSEKAVEFFKRGTRDLGKQPGVTPELVDRDLTVVLHDPTAIRYEGYAPTMDEVEDIQTEVFSWFSDMGVLLTPISTNDAEYTVGANVAHNTGRDITAVGRNAELRTACKNLFGMLHDFDVSGFKLDPFEEAQKKDSLIPQDVLNIYFSSLEQDIEVDKVSVTEDHMDAAYDEVDSDPEDENYAEQVNQKAFQIAYEEEVAKKRRIAQQKAMKAFKETLEPSERTHEKNVRKFMLDSLFKNGAVVFNNDFNDYLMYKAIIDRKDTASIRATRTSQMAKDFRIDPGRLMIFITGTQGNAEERFSTLQKFSDFFSLLDVDESVRNTGYKINAKNFIAVVTQPPIPGNENGQENLINDLVNKRDITVVGAFMNGFKVYNPKDKLDPILKRLRRLGWNHEVDVEGNIRVYAKPIHVHGHGFREDLLNIAKAAPAEFHECHHIPDHDSYNIFRSLMKDNGRNHSGIQPDDFQVYRINANAATNEDKYKKVAQLNPSYVLVKMARKYGQYFGGWLQLMRATLLRREGNSRSDGLMARTTSDGVYTHKTAQQAWEEVSNPENFEAVARTRKIGPSRVDRGQGKPRHRSRPVWSGIGPKSEVA